MRTTIVIYLMLLSFFSSAQKKSESDYSKELNKIGYFFQTNINPLFLRNANQLYVFALEIDLTKKKWGGYEVNSILANDTIAYYLYPNFNQLKKVKYWHLIKHRKNSSLILPVIIDVWKDNWTTINPEQNLTHLLQKVFCISNGEVEIVHKRHIYLPPQYIKFDLSIID